MLKIKQNIGKKIISQKKIINKYNFSKLKLNGTGHFEKKWYCANHNNQWLSELSYVTSL